MVILPFKPIKLKTPRGASRPFPREIRSISAAKDFVKLYAAHRDLTAVVRCPSLLRPRSNWLVNGRLSTALRGSGTPAQIYSYLRRATTAGRLSGSYRSSR